MQPVIWAATQGMSVQVTLGMHQACEPTLIARAAGGAGEAGEAEDGAGSLRPRLAPWPAAKALLESLRPHDHHHVSTTRTASALAHRQGCTDKFCVCLLLRNCTKKAPSSILSVIYKEARHARFDNLCRHWTLH